MVKKMLVVLSLIAIFFLGYKAYEDYSIEVESMALLLDAKSKANEAVEKRASAIFIKHGDSAAEALIKHPNLADGLIERFGGDAATALTAISRPNAQRLGMIANEGLLSATARSPELLPVIRQYGDSAMEFIWNNKGALAVATVLGTFLADPKPYISGVSELVVPLLSSINWTLIVTGIFALLFLPFIARSVAKTRKVFVNAKDQ